MKRPKRFVLPEGVKSLGINIPGLDLAPKANKYKAKPTAYRGVRYASKAEAARAMALDDQRDHGVISWWLGQPAFRLGCPENKYIADFLVVSSAGVRVEDVKGISTAKFNRDRKLWAAYGPTNLWVIRGGKVVEIIEGKDGR